MLYSDDTSGNISKKWNKHMSFYCNLAGLPPKMTNQEYNIHFISTSNAATALESADSLVDELCVSATKGFKAIDCESNEKVLVMVVILCHMGDSPMHAEITNTMNPATALAPCRVCDLHVDKKENKRTSKYVGDFVGVDENGDQKKIPL
ncbi:hypothetical protein CROQUDRAFT_61614 [Cronartium quercuum f. sp. fusiforme G11]|uniref:Uncharacterized protein n=1 Tax=Cronartium quercuum f. sp. fusiforme G11 TaxID=708437 RepID=A0A9P6NKW5_9BASI|nr:hypothetical protein CROQUDRAFT_61614 [Cronartium quercuum f. sp. fusiforme G11]